MHALHFSGPARLAGVLPQTLPIPQFPFTVGRGTKADARVQATPAALGIGDEAIPIISRAHAVIERTADGGLLVRDLGSVNGTWWLSAAGAIAADASSASGPSQSSQGASSEDRVRLRKSAGRTEHALAVGESLAFGNKLVQYTLRAGDADDDADDSDGDDDTDEGAAPWLESSSTDADEPADAADAEPVASRKRSNDAPPESGGGGDAKRARRPVKEEPAARSPAGGSRSSAAEARAAAAEERARQPIKPEPAASAAPSEQTGTRTGGRPDGSPAAPKAEPKAEPIAELPTWAAAVLADEEPAEEPKAEPKAAPKAKPSTASAASAAAAAAKDADTSWVDDEIQCCICMAPLAFATSLGCGHLLCWVCGHQLLNCSRTPQCPQCRQPASHADLRRNPGMDNIVAKFLERNKERMAGERDQWDERYAEGKRLEEDHRNSKSNGAAAARGGGGGTWPMYAPPPVHVPAPPVVRRAEANLELTVHLAPCGTACEVCHGHGAAPDPRPGVVGEQLAAMLRITGLPAESAANATHTINHTNQRLIGNRGRTFHLECADVPALVGRTAVRARPAAAAARAAGEVTVAVHSELDATARGWQRAEQRALVVASLRARLRAAAGSSEWWWRCAQSGGVWEADPEAGNVEVWSDGEGVDEGATVGGGGRPVRSGAGGHSGFAMYERDAFINDDAEDSGEYDDDDDEDESDEESEEEEESDESMERYQRRGW